jgi:hypothetical protein
MLPCAMLEPLSVLETLSVPETLDGAELGENEGTCAYTVELKHSIDTIKTELIMNNNTIPFLLLLQLLPLSSFIANVFSILISA